MQCLECVSYDMLLLVYIFIKSTFFFVEVKNSCTFFRIECKQTADYQQPIVTYICIPVQFHALY